MSFVSHSNGDAMRSCIRFHFANETSEAALSRTEWEFWNKFDLLFNVFFLSHPLEIIEDRAHLQQKEENIRIRVNRLLTTCTNYEIYNSAQCNCGKRESRATWRSESKMCDVPHEQLNRKKNVHFVCHTAYWRRHRSRFHARQFEVCGERWRKNRVPLGFVLF